MKVAVVVTQDRGGPVDLTVALARELAGRASGPEVFVVGPVPVAGALDLADQLVPVGVRSLSDVTGLSALRRALTRLRPDVVHAQDRRAALLAATGLMGRGARGRTVHGLPDHTAGGWIDARARALLPSRPVDTLRVVTEAAVCRRLGVVVAPSEAMRRFLVDRMRVPAHRVRLIPNGVALQSPSLPSGAARVFVSVGSFAACKAMPVLVTAFSQVAATRPDVRLVLVGEGADRARCAGMVGEAGLDGRVTFTGYRTDVPAVLAAADAFVLPSLNENQPLALLEAMAAGLPCVASDVGGIPEVLAGATGILVPPGDAGALAAAMARLADNPALAGRLGQAAFLRVQEGFAISACATAHTLLWQELAGEAA